MLTLLVTRSDVYKSEHAMAVLLYGKFLFPSVRSEEGCRRGFKLLSDTVSHLGTLQLAVFAAT